MGLRAQRPHYIRQWLNPLIKVGKRGGAKAEWDKLKEAWLSAPDFNFFATANQQETGLAAGVLYRVDRWRGMEAAGVFAERQDQKLTRRVERDGAEYLSYGFALADYPALVVAYWCDNERLPLESAALDRMIGRQPAAHSAGRAATQPSLLG